MIENILLILLVLILAAKLIGALFEKIGLDSTLGELFTGVLFGPSLLNLIHAESIESFAIIGSILILFVAGMNQRDIGKIYKDKPSLHLGSALLLITSLLMGAFFYFVPKYFGIEFTIIQAGVMGLAFGIVDIGVPAKIFISKGLIRTPAAKIAIRSSIVNVILGLLIFTLLTLFINPVASSIILKLGGMFLFLLFTVMLVYLLTKISRFVSRIKIEEAEFSLAFVLVLALAYFTDVIGFSSVLGAFVAGVLITKAPFVETKSFTDKIKSVSFGLFVPLFFVWFGLEIHLSEIWKHIILAVLIFVSYATIRFLITWLYLKEKKMKKAELISSSMLSVDVESLVVLMLAMQLGIFVTEMPLTLFAPSVFFSTFFIVVFTGIFNKKK